MTRFPGFSATAAIALGAALSMLAGLAFADDDLADQIVTTLTRSVGAKADSGTPAKPSPLLESLRSRGSRSLSSGERKEIANIAEVKPAIDLDIQFDYDSAEISIASMPTAQSLGRALTNPALRGLVLLIAGHTDAMGSEAYNQELSERRAGTIKRYLIEKFGIAGTDLIAVGYGKSKLKKPDAPMDAINRRVQVVNMETRNAAK
jgi:outer membrane protein OmpA-like peptidoglycan-associated protein